MRPHRTVRKPLRTFRSDALRQPRGELFVELVLLGEDIIELRDRDFGCALHQ